MLSSVRARLTLWHTSVLAVLLASFALAAYAFVVSTSRARTDAAVLDAVSDLQTELTNERQHQSTTRAAAEEVLHELRFRRIGFAVFDRSGTLLAASLPRARPLPGEEPDPGLDIAYLSRWLGGHSPSITSVVTVPDQEGGYRVALVSVVMPDGRYTAAAAISTHREEETLSEARLAVFVAIPVALLLGSLGGSLLARRYLRPMVMMRDSAARIGASSLGERLPVTNPSDEVGQLASVINDLLARLEFAFARQRQFMADASHELRTPVAVVQHEASFALSRTQRDENEYRDSLTVVRDAGRRMRLIVEDLLLLARADAGEIPLRREPLYLNDLVADCARAVRSLAQSRGIVLALQHMDDAPFTGDEALLHRLVVNLLDNAIKYSPSGAVVTLRLAAVGETYRLDVEDTGPGIPADAQPQVFERFVRADRARTRDEGQVSGAGLGLSIARWIAEAHGGTLALVRSTPAGSVFVLTLPITSG